MRKHWTPLLILSFLLWTFCLTGQVVPIESYSTNADGQVQLTINSVPSKYYVLHIKNEDSVGGYIPTSMIMGATGTTTITEPLQALPVDQYEVREYDIASPEDTDGDGIDDITEYENRPQRGPLNAAFELDPADGSATVETFSQYKSLAFKKDNVQWSEFLNGKEFVKYLIILGEEPEVFFIDSEKHNLHADFSNAVGIDILDDRIVKGQVIYHPASIAANGTKGTFAFNYSNGKPEAFEDVQRTHELLAANMPFVHNNLSYLITDQSEEQYDIDIARYEASRIPVLFEADIYANVDYWGVNQAEGYGLLRHITNEEVPGPKDIVLYETLPNSLPRVGGIITSVVQTPLSHVNLRAIQNNIPNAFIRDPFAIDSIVALIDDYVYLKVEQNTYTIRKATLQEVNEWFDDIRPTEQQNPPLNLEYTDILPLADITFDMFDGFGAKCANIATMQTFGFPANTIPDGYGVPFYYYQEFMKYNDFFTDVEELLSRNDFIEDRTVRDNLLADFRKKIKAADMPQWMLDELATMHASFPAGTSIRCRSSSNNEDLAGFNGAGLYDSKTQHPDEGHISKSIKQVFASLWNLRAYEERDFYRVNHYTASMGVLCHPNYKEEIANGVGVSIDPLYGTTNTHYLNTQLGENLITNPEDNSIPEEILIDRTEGDNINYNVLQYSSLAEPNTILMTKEQLEQLRDYLNTIHEEFEILYEAQDDEGFGMDIEYKITKENQLIIKQARPWVHFNPIEEEPEEAAPALELSVYPNPASEALTVVCPECSIDRLLVTDINNRVIESVPATFSEGQLTLPIRAYAKGVYLLTLISTDGSEYSKALFLKM